MATRKHALWAIVKAFLFGCAETLHDMLFRSMARQGLVLGANTLTNLIPQVYASLDVVSRELVGFIPSVMRDSRADRVAVNQSLTIPVTPTPTAGNITPGVTPPDDGDQTIDNVEFKITKSRRVPFRWQGEESRGLNNGGPGVSSIRGDQVTQAIRVLVNEMEADLAALHIYASRAYGATNALLFATNLSASAQLRKLLDDNGAPLTDRSLVIGTDSGAQMRTLGQLTKANEAADTGLLRQGTLLDIHGFAIRESAAVKTSTAGTGASATTNNAGYAVGATVITLASAGTGTVVAGDIVQFAGDGNMYVVASGDSDVSNGGTITLAAPGLQKAIAGVATNITIVAASTRAMAFSRNAVLLGTRAPALPDGGDSAIDRTMVTDPRSGISFEIAMYAQYRQMQYEVSAAWGVKVIKPAHLVVGIGQVA